MSFKEPLTKEPTGPSSISKKAKLCETLGLAVRQVRRGFFFLLVGLLVGCSGWNLRGEGFAENELSEFCGQYRRADLGTGPAGVSTKAQQIERSLGVHP